VRGAKVWRLAFLVSAVYLFGCALFIVPSSPTGHAVLDTFLFAVLPVILVLVTGSRASGTSIKRAVRDSFRNRR